jgi:hypothetical protein
LPAFGAGEQPASQTDTVNTLFPALDELPGGRQHWVQTLMPTTEANDCKVYSATYAYFASVATPLFDIPRKNVYSVNVRFHECANIADAAKLYTKFAKVGDSKQKRFVGIGEKGTLYVIPDKKNPMMGEYYMTSLLRSYVMQVHSDDGFVLMDLSDMLIARLSTILGLDKSLANGITLLFQKDGYLHKSEYVTFSGDNITSVELSGTVYDLHNKRLANTVVTVRETGKTVNTDKDGNYKLTLDTAGKTKRKRKNIKLFRAVEMAFAGKLETVPLRSAFYKVDMTYKLENNKVSQNIWKLTISPDTGKVVGTSLNLSDNARLGLNGTITKEKIELTRDCGNSVLGTCKQQLIANFDPYTRMYAGSWTGTGGGGQLAIYADSFDTKPQRLSRAEAGYKVKGSVISSGKKTQYISLTPTVKAHSDFYTKSAQLILTIKPQTQVDVHRVLYLYEVQPNGKLKTIASTAPLSLMDKEIQTSIDISGIYRSATAKEYRIGFASKSKEELSVKVNIAFEVSLAAGQSKLRTDGTAKALLIGFNGDDFATNSKVPAADGQRDVEFMLDLHAYGSILTGVEIRSMGDDRQWNTDITSFHPAVAVRKKGLTLNEANGTLSYPLQELNEQLQLYISKGSTNVEKIYGFEITVILDTGRVTFPVSINKL